MGFSQKGFSRGDAAALLVAVVAVLALLAVGTARLFNPFSLTHFESGQWRPAAYLAEGRNPYERSLPVEPPYVTCAYGPVFYELIGLGMRLGGTQLWTGRALCLVSLAMCLVLLATLTWRFTHDRNLTILAVAIFAAQLPVQAWAGMQKADYLALAFSLGGLVVALYPPTHRRRWLRAAVAALLLTTALLSRQTCVLPIFAVLVWFYLHRMTSDAVVFGLVLVIGVGGTFAAFDWTSGGGFTWQLYVLQSAASRSVERMVGHLVTLGRAPASWVILAAVLGLLRDTAAGPLSRAPQPESGSAHAYLRVLWVYLFLATGLALVTSVRQGSYLNYWLEPCAAVALVLPVAWKEMSLREGRQPGRIEAAVFLGALGVSSIYTSSVLVRAELQRYERAAEIRDIVSEIGNKTPEDEPSYSEYPELMVLAGRDYYFADCWQYDERNAEMQRAFLKAVEDRVFPAIVDDQVNSPPGYHRGAASCPALKVYLHLRD